MSGQMPRAKTLAVRLQPEHWDSFNEIRELYAQRYPGIEMTDAAVIKIMMANVKRAELGPPPAPSSRSVKKTSRPKR